MILQKLCDYYDRLQSDPDSDVAPFGYVVQGVAFEVIIQPDGALVGIHDVRDLDGKGTPRNKVMILPGKSKPSGSGLNPSLWGWDRTDYMLGFIDLEPLSPSERDARRKRCAKAHEEYRKEMLAREAEIGEPDYSAFCKFLRSWRPEMAANYPILKEVSGSFGVVRLSGQPPRYLHDLPALREQADEEDEVIGRCLVTGDEAEIARIHDVKIKGVNGAQSTGATLVGFNLDAFESRGHEQSYNAPVGIASAFKYATALNKLLERGGGHRVQVGDATCIFWADAPTLGELVFGYALSDAPEGAPAEDSDTAKEVAAALRSLKQGIAAVPDSDIGFHVLAACGKSIGI